MLSRSSAAVFGSTTLTLFQPESDNGWTPNNLNIAVPWHKSQLFINFLTEEGYIQRPKSKMPYRWYHLIHCHRPFMKEGHPMIFITEGTYDNIVPTIVGTSTTATMNALTSRSFYSFYPQFTRKKWTFSNWPTALTGEPAKFLYRGYKYFRRPPLRLDNSCTFACPNNPRRLRGRRHMGTHVWNTEGKEERRLDTFEIIWQLGTTCTNVRCKYQPYKRISSASTPSL